MAVPDDVLIASRDHLEEVVRKVLAKRGLYARGARYWLEQDASCLVEAVLGDLEALAGALTLSELLAEAEHLGKAERIEPAYPDGYTTWRVPTPGMEAGHACPASCEAAS